MKEVVFKGYFGVGGIVLAPTGTAAALLNGSTYHSILGVPIDGQTVLRNETTKMHKSKQGWMELIIFFWMKSLWFHTVINTRSVLSLQRS